MAGITQTISDQFAKYAEAVQSGNPQAEKYRSELFLLCEKGARSLQNRYGMLEKVVGDRLYDAIVDKFLKLTDPNKIADIDPRTFGQLYFTSVQRGMVDALRAHGRHQTLSLDSLDHWEELTTAAAVTDRAPDDSAVILTKLRQQLSKLSSGALETLAGQIEAALDPTHGIKQKHLAQQQDIPHGTVKSRLHQARKAISDAGVGDYTLEELPGPQVILTAIHEQIRQKHEKADVRQRGAAAKSPHFLLKPNTGQPETHVEQLLNESASAPYRDR